MVDAALRTNLRNATISVGTSPVLVSQQLQYGQRQVLAIVNTSSSGQVITLAWGIAGATSGAGVVLYPAGTWSESIDSAFIPTNADIYAVSNAASGTLAVHERIFV